MPGDGRGGTMTARIILMIFLDALALSVWASLVSIRVIAVYPSALMLLPTLLVSNFLILRASRPLRVEVPKLTRAYRILRMGAMVVTAALVINFVYFVYKPSALSAAPVAGGIAYVGFYAYILRRIKNSTQPPES
jgi:amino acid transporter